MPEPLGDADDFGPTGQSDLDLFRHEVGGHDGSSEIVRAVAETRAEPRQRVFDNLDRQRLADHPGTGGEEVLHARQAEARSAQGGEGLVVLSPLFPGRTVGVAAIDYDAVNRFVTLVTRAVARDARCLEQVFGGHIGPGERGGGDDDAQVGFAGGFQSRRNARRSENLVAASRPQPVEDEALRLVETVDDVETLNRLSRRPFS